MSHNHSHGHSHGHGHTGDISGQRALLWSLLLNGVFLLLELGVGVWSGSLALLSDAAHMLSDVGALLLALAAGRLALVGASAARTFGLRRAEVLGGFLNGLTQVVACAYITWEAIARLLSGPPEVPGLPILLVGGAGLLINLGSAWMLYRADRGNINIRGALIHMLADALGSVGAMIAAGLVLAGIPAADPVVSLLLAALVLWGTWGLLRDAGRVLLELPPPWLDVQALCDLLAADPDVRSVHDVHVWSLDGQSPLVTGHIVVDDLLQGEAARARLGAQLRQRFSVQHLTLQVETAASGHPCPSGDCGAPSAAAPAPMPEPEHHGHTHDHGHAHHH